MPPSTRADAVDDDEDDDDDAEPDDEQDADDGEADPDPEARGDSTRETCAVAARDAGGTGCEGGSLGIGRRLEGKLEEPSSGGDGSALGTCPHSTARLQASSFTLAATATSRLKDLGRAARTEETCCSRARVDSTDRPPVQERLKRAMTCKTMGADRPRQRTLGEEWAPRLVSRNGQVARNDDERMAAATTDPRTIGSSEIDQRTMVSRGEWAPRERRTCALRRG